MLPLVTFGPHRMGLSIPLPCMNGNLSYLAQMDQRPWPGPPVVFHIRMQLLMGLLWCIDVLLFMFMIDNMILSGVGGSVLFASEVRRSFQFDQLSR